MELIKKIKKIKKYRMIPHELFLYNIFINFTKYSIIDKFYYVFNNEIYIEYSEKTNVIWYHRYKINDILLQKYKLSQYEIFCLIEKFTNKILKLKNTKPMIEGSWVLDTIWKKIDINKLEKQ